MLGLFYPYGIFLQAIAILHFVRRRPDTYWLFIILMGGAVGALAYIVVEVIPDAGLLRGAFQVFPRRKRIKELEGAILDNPSIGNYEELGDLYLDDQQFARARECFDRVISRSDSIDPFYRRALCEIALDDFPSAAADLEQVILRDPKYDYQRAAGLRAHALAKTGEREKADALFADVTEPPTLATGSSASFARRRRCPTTFVARNGHGFEGPARFSSGCPAGLPHRSETRLRFLNRPAALGRTDAAMLAHRSRRTIRLPGWEYSDAGAYFVTVIDR